MKTQKTLLTLMLASAVVVPFVTSAGVPNPDNDSGTYFTYKPAPATQVAPATQRGLPAIGAISDDGLYVWKSPDKGWVPRSHSYVFTAGRFEHAPDCLAYNLPRPTGARTPDLSKGS